MIKQPKTRWALAIFCLLLSVTGGMIWTVSLHRRQDALDAALFNAIARNDSPRLHALLTEGANPNAIYRNHKPRPFLDVWKQMFGLDPVAAKGRVTALISAAELGRLDITKALIEAHANVNMQNGEGWTALHAAAMTHRQDTSAILLLLAEHGADINAKTLDGKTVWYLARNNPTSLQTLRHAAGK